PISFSFLFKIVEEEFQFLLCEKCQKEARNPKLLSCLHTLCSDCIGENKPIGLCPICRAPILDANGIPDQDNLLFANLQAKLHTFRKIVTGNDLVCSNDRCKKSAEFWCSDCEALLCAQCFEGHQVFFKKNHEARKVTDLKMESAKQFLEGAKKSSNLFCSSASHQNKGKITSIYCRGCEKPLCCSCAFLDREHTNLCCDIHLEIQRRQEELS
uniref:Uncharacterized protein n=1 Tax=Sphenodon punctatus TaxID=8508 RepID=A0A8D0GKT3_SPHPU